MLLTRNALDQKAGLLQELEQMQESTHAWGSRNQVIFDPGKEHQVILYPSATISHGDDFRLLGTFFLTLG